jgi:hypothetical protein
MSLSLEQVAAVRRVIATSMASLAIVLEHPLCRDEFRHVMVQAVTDLFELGLAPNENTLATVHVINRAVTREIEDWTRFRKIGATTVVKPYQFRSDLN